MKTRRVVFLGALVLALSALTGTTWLIGSAGAPGASSHTALAPAAAQSGDAIDPGDWRQENVALATDAAGNLYVAWTDYRNAGVSHIRFAYRLGGGGWTASVRVDATGAGNQILPSMAVDETRNVYLAWQDFRDGAALPQIRFAYRPAGGAWSASQVISPTTQAQIQPALAVNASGATIVAWAQRAAQQKPLDMYVAARPAGGGWGAGEAVLPAASGSRTDPHVGLDEAGRAYLVWTEQAAAGPGVGFSTRPTGGAWSAPEKVNDAATNAGWVVARLAAPMRGGGPIHAIWMDARSGNQDIYHATRPLTGAWSANVKVNDDGGATEQLTPSLALDAAGNATAVWVDQRSGRWDLYRAVRPAGGGWGANTLLVAGPTAGTQALVAPRLTGGCTNNPVTNGSDTGYSQGNPSDQCVRHNVYVTSAEPMPTRTPTTESTHTPTTEPTRTPTITPSPTPPVNAWVDENGVLHVVLQGGADATVTVKDGQVLVNGEPVGDPPVKATDIKGIDVRGGTGDNAIDLRGVARADFTSLNDQKVKVYAGDGRDAVWGSEFGDVIWGEGGSDTLMGGDGNDFIDGGLPNEEDTDILDGGYGHDMLFGGGGADIIFDGPGHDDVHGGPGNDILYNGTGIDTIDTGTGNDTIKKRPGWWLPVPITSLSGQSSDVANDTPGTIEILSDEGGDDTIDFSEVTAGITIDLDLTGVDQEVDTAGHALRLEGQFENFVGSAFDDLVFVGALTVTRRLDGGPHVAGDTLKFDAHGAWVADDGATITAAGYAPVTYTGFEAVAGTRPCPALAPGESWAQTFAVPGSYPYFDAHAPGYTGAVVVGSQTRRVSPNLSGTASISITDAGFDPPSVTIAAGDTARWTNRGAGVHAVAGGAPRKLYLPLALR